MKKIDLHIHTKSADRERSFVFDLERLREYVRVLEIDCISITNHNEFDLSQFEEIQTALDILVLPGIEIDLEGGQILLIGEASDLGDFDSRCRKINEREPNKRDSVSVEELKEIFGDLSKYLLIPHYDKDPAIKDETLDALGTYLLYTSKEMNTGKVVYRIYSGFPTDKKLQTTDGTTVSTWEVTMGSLEAGVDAYDDRRRGYEDIKD